MKSFSLKAAVSSIAFIFALFLGHSVALADTAPTISSNWAGYVAQNGAYTGVSGTWIVPALTPSTMLTSNATWVGIGGRTTADIIQAGVYEVTNSSGLVYQAWYELLPDNSTPVNLTVSPGDSISVAIIETSQDSWNVVITNNTTKQQYEKTVTYHSSLSSAEWIQERPLVNQTFSDLSGFTPVTFTGATAVQNGQRISLAQTNPQMLNLLDVPTNTALAVPSPVATNGMNFTVFRTSAVSTPGATSSATIIPPAPSIDAQIPPFELHRTGWDILRIYF